MNKLIGKYSNEKDDVIVLCECGGSDHHLRITKWKDEPKEFTEFYISVVPAKFDFWTRVKFALDMLWSGPHNDEVIIGVEEMKELIKTLNTILLEMAN